MKQWQENYSLIFEYSQRYYFELKTLYNAWFIKRNRKAICTTKFTRVVRSYIAFHSGRTEKNTPM